MKVIYKPKGRAAEYAELACNLYGGCTNGCQYCYVPGVLHRTKADFHKEVTVRRDILNQVTRDAYEMMGDERVILFCFTTDPYPEEHSHITRAVLEVMEVAGLNVSILTKAGTRAVRDFDLLERNRWRFGTSLVWADDKLRAKYEPHAATVAERLTAITQAKARGIHTWVSLEPVINPEEALKVIRLCGEVVDHWKVGKLNHGAHLGEELAEIERETDWAEFYRAVTEELAGRSFYIKEDLRRAAGVEE